MGAAVALALSACASDADNTPSGSATPTGEVTTLDLWAYYAGTQAPWLAGQVKDFEANNPGVKINVIQTVASQHDQKLLAAAATGTTPDLFVNNIVVDFPTLAAGGVFADLTPYWEKYADAAQFPASAVWKDDGKVKNLLPFTDVVGMFYNIDILSQYGITDPPKTLDQLQADMKIVTADGKYKGLALSGAPTVEGAWLFAPQLLAVGVNYCNFEGPKVQTAFDRLDSWASAGYIPKSASTWDQNAAWQQFMTGEYAFAFNGNWQLGSVQEASFKYGTAQYPPPQGGVSQVYPGGEGYAIGSKSKHPDLAWKFLEEAILTRQAGESTFEQVGSISVRADAADSGALKEDPFVAPFVIAASDPGTWPRSESTAEIQTALGIEASAVISGQRSGKQGADNAIKNIAEGLTAGGGSC